MRWESNAAGWEGLQVQRKNLWPKWEGDLFEKSLPKGGERGKKWEKSKKKKKKQAAD